MRISYDKLSLRKNVTGFSVFGGRGGGGESVSSGWVKEDVFYFTRWCSLVHFRAPTSNPSIAINSRDMNTFKVSGKCKIT